MQSAGKEDLSKFRGSEITRLRTAYQAIPKIEADEKTDEDTAIASLRERKDKIERRIAKLASTTSDVESVLTPEAFNKEVAAIDDQLARLKTQLQEDGAELGFLMNQSTGIQNSPFTPKPNPAKNRALVSGGAVVSGGMAGLIGACSFSLGGIPLVLLIVLASLLGGLLTHAVKSAYDSYQRRRISTEYSRFTVSSMQSSPSSTAMMMGGIFPGKSVKLSGDRSMASENVDAYLYPTTPLTPPAQQSQADSGLAHRNAGSGVQHRKSF